MEPTPVFTNKIVLRRHTRARNLNIRTPPHTAEFQDGASHLVANFTRDTFLSWFLKAYCVIVRLSSIKFIANRILKYSALKLAANTDVYLSLAVITI